MENKNIKIAKTAIGALKILWQEKFFRSWRKSGEIIEYLSKRGNNFSLAAIGMALKETKYLIRKGKRGAYKYIQKYPYFPEKKKNNTII